MFFKSLINKTIIKLSRKNLSPKGNMYVNKDNFSLLRSFFDGRIIYSAIPKSGNTNVQYLFQLLDSEITLEKILKREQFYRENRRIKIHSMKDFLKLSVSYKITFVRNPYTRALSVFKHKILNLKESPIYNSDKKVHFYNFLRSLKKGILDSDKHFFKQIDCLYFEKNDYDYIGKLENFYDDFNVSIPFKKKYRFKKTITISINFYSFLIKVRKVPL